MEKTGRVSTLSSVSAVSVALSSLRRVPDRTRLTSLSLARGSPVSASVARASVRFSSAGSRECGSFTALMIGSTVRRKASIEVGAPERRSCRCPERGSCPPGSGPGGSGGSPPPGSGPGGSGGSPPPGSGYSGISGRDLSGPPCSSGPAGGGGVSSVVCARVALASTKDRRRPSPGVKARPVSLRNSSRATGRSTSRGSMLAPRREGEWGSSSRPSPMIAARAVAMAPVATSIPRAVAIRLHRPPSSSLPLSSGMPLGPRSSSAEGSSQISGRAGVYGR